MNRVITIRYANDDRYVKLNTNSNMEIGELIIELLLGYVITPFDIPCTIDAYNSVKDDINRLLEVCFYTKGFDLSKKILGDLEIMIPYVEHSGSLACIYAIGHYINNSSTSKISQIYSSNRFVSSIEDFIIGDVRVFEKIYLRRLLSNNINKSKFTKLIYYIYLHNDIIRNGSLSKTILDYNIRRFICNVGYKKISVKVNILFESVKLFMHYLVDM